MGDGFLSSLLCLRMLQLVFWSQAEYNTVLLLFRLNVIITCITFNIDLCKTFCSTFVPHALMFLLNGSLLLTITMFVHFKPEMNDLFLLMCKHAILYLVLCFAWLKVTINESLLASHYH